MPHFPPRHICIVGALCISTGIGSVIGMIVGLIGETFTFDLGFVAIPIGYGILIGRASSRRWAIFFAVIGFLLGSGFGGWAFFEHFTGRDTLPYPDATYVAVELVLALAGCIYVVLVLTRKVYDEHFESIAEPTAPLKSIAWAVSVTSAVLLGSYYASEWWIGETHARIFPFRVTVAPYDAKNGEGLNSISYDSDHLSISSRSKPDFPKVDVSFVSSQEGMRLEFSGIATGPVEFTIRSEGYQDTPITLHQGSDDEIRLAMLPIEASAPERGSADKAARNPESE